MKVESLDLGGTSERATPPCNWSSRVQSDSSAHHRTITKAAHPCFRAQQFAFDLSRVQASCSGPSQ